MVIFHPGMSAFWLFYYTSCVKLRYICLLVLYSELEPIHMKVALCMLRKSGLRQAKVAFDHKRTMKAQVNLHIHHENIPI